uniref:uncharacterized protein LOC105350663 n=1 Tax=Fragaria vesca subsp. vesca TaxID=101020 RepID=UPI0005CAA0D1|nr:PREDICTED: uncharacterized protein LOC105350663 [Fragaria vesca subsp. vesca]
MSNSQSSERSPEPSYPILPTPLVDGELIYLQAFGDNVCVFDFGNVDTAGSIDLWVMKNYGVTDSWAKLFNLKVTNQHEKIVWLCPILVLETATFLEKKTIESDVLKLISSSHTKEELETHVCSGDVNLIDLIQYEETLLWLGVSILVLLYFISPASP